MNDIKTDIYNTLTNKWLRDFNGQGSVKILKPLSGAEYAFSIIKRFVTKKPDSKILVCVDSYNTRKDILDKCKAENIPTNRLTVLSYSYINARFNYNYDLSICVGLDGYSSTSEVVFSTAKWYMFIVTDVVRDSKKLAEVYKYYKCVNPDINSNVLNAVRTSSPVEERRLGLNMSDEDYAEYEKQTNHITKSLNIFGDFNILVKCLVGDKEHNVSAEQCRAALARLNGWSETLDTSLPFNKDIDDTFNPDAIENYASTINGIIKERNLLMDSNEVKIPVIVDIIKNNPDKRFIIISKRGEFAARITKAINEEFGYERCGNYHDSIEPKMLVDSNGNPVLYKSGVNKGKPRVVKAKAISSLNANKYDNDKDLVHNSIERTISSPSDELSLVEPMSCLSVKLSFDSELEASCDRLILTSWNVDTPAEVLYRFNKIDITGTPYIIYRLYLRHTNEEKNINAEKPNNTKIVEFENNDKNFLDIVCG